MRVVLRRPLRTWPFLPGEVVGVRGPIDGETAVHRLAGPLARLQGCSEKTARGIARAIVRNLREICEGKGPALDSQPVLELVERSADAPPPLVATVAGPHVVAVVQELEARGIRCLVSRTPVAMSLFAAARCSPFSVNFPDIPAALSQLRGKPAAVFSFPDHQWSGQACAIPMSSFGRELLWGVHEAVLWQTGCCGGMFFLGVEGWQAAPGLDLQRFGGTIGEARTRDVVAWLARNVEALAGAEPEAVFSWWWLAWKEAARAARRKLAWARLDASLDLLDRLVSGPAEPVSDCAFSGHGRRFGDEPRDGSAGRSSHGEGRMRSTGPLASLAPVFWRPRALARTADNLGEVYGRSAPARAWAREHCAHQVLLGLEHRLLVGLPAAMVRRSVQRRVRFASGGVEEVLGSDGRGTLILTPHFGSFSVGALALALRIPRQRRLAFFYEDPGNNPAVAYFDRLFERLCPEVEKLRPTLSGLRTAMRLLGQGGVVCLMPDVYKMEEGTFFVPFLGHLCPFMGGAAYLWQRSGARLMVGACMRRRGWRWDARMVVLPESRVWSEEEGSAETELYARTAYIAAAIEDVIHSAPPLWAYWSSWNNRAVPWNRARAGHGALARVGERFLATAAPPLEERKGA